MGRLDVRINEARNLPDMSLTGSGASDVFITVEVGDRKFQTSVCEGRKNPKWDEVFKFTVADPSSARVTVKAYNKGLTSDDFLGSYKCSLDGLSKGEPKSDWHIFEQCKTNAEFNVTLLALDFGEEPQITEGQVVGEAQGSHTASWGTNSNQAPVAAVQPQAPPAAAFAQPQWSPDIKETYQPSQLEQKLNKVTEKVGGVIDSLVSKIDNKPSKQEGGQ